MAIVGKYELIEELGRGSMGTVYVARDAVLERDVALKTIRTGLNVDPEIRERFYREAKTCAKLTHPSIVTVYDMGEDNGTAFIAMELLKGSDFREHVVRKAKIPLHVKLEAIIQICDGLAHAHREGIIHRDVKPSNLFFDSNRRCAKILDFGIARLPSSKLTVLGRVLGTPNYMAPEQILNQKSDGRADLFSAAIVFFEFLVYSHPFQSALIPRRVVDDEPDSLFDYDSGIPRPFEKVFNKALQKRPEERYATADELASDMRSLLEAIRANSSPSSSQWLLPSIDTQSIAALPQRPILNDELPDVNDPEEWRLAEFLLILPEFEAAADRKDFAKAKDLLIKLRQIEAVDHRFTDSIKLCEARLDSATPVSTENKVPDVKPEILAESSALAASASGGVVLESRESPKADHPVGPPLETHTTQTSSQRPPPQRPQGRLKPCETCGAINRMTATFCAICGNKLELVSTESPSSVEQRSPGTDRIRPISQSSDGPLLSSHFDPPTVLDAGTKRVPHMSDMRIRLLIGLAALFCILLVCLLFWLLRRPPAPVGYIARATVMAETSRVYHSPDSSASSFAILKSGTVLHILQLPRSGEDRWLLVEPVVDGRPGPQGYVTRESLGEFDSDDPVRAMALASDLAPQIDPTDDDLARQIRTFNIIASRFRGTPTGKTATIQMASRELALARNLASEGRPDADWKFWTNRARIELSTVSGPETTQVLQSIAAMETESASKRKIH